MSVGKNIIKHKKIMQPLSEFITGLPSESLLLITLNNNDLSIVAGENLSEEGAWSLARLAMTEIEIAENKKYEVQNGKKK